MRRRPNEKRDNWLLIKQHDDAARTPRQRDILLARPLSVKTGRTMDEIAQHERKAKRKSKSVTLKRKRKAAKRSKRKVKRAKRR